MYVLRWDKGALKTLARGATLWTLTKWRFTDRIHLKLDAAHPLGASQHQKIVVIDDCIAFCGGNRSYTSNRWDTLRAHRQRPSPEGTVAAAIQAVARHLDRYPGGRGQGAGRPLPRTLVAGRRRSRSTRPNRAGNAGRTDCPSISPDAQVAIARSQPDWGEQQQRVLEIETLFLDMIARAKRRLYVENQYFASRRIAEAIALRLEEPDGPEIVVISPIKSQGVIEPIAMDSGRARLVAALRSRDAHGRFRRSTTPSPRAERQIYCHAKVMVVDDVAIRVGSSNFNNRSLRLDTECDVLIDSEVPGNEGARAPASPKSATA